MNKMTILLMTILTAFFACNKDEEQEPTTTTEILYTMPEESEPHEGTWLQWPHQYQYGVAYRNGLDATWIAMTQCCLQPDWKRQNNCVVKFCKRSIGKCGFQNL